MFLFTGFNTFYVISLQKSKVLHKVKTSPNSENGSDLNVLVCVQTRKHKDWKQQVSFTLVPGWSIKVSVFTKIHKVVHSKVRRQHSLTPGHGGFVFSKSRSIALWDCCQIATYMPWTLPFCSIVEVWTALYRQTLPPIVKKHLSVRGDFGQGHRFQSLC